MPQEMMTRLPPEILNAICAQLCVHCKNKGKEKHGLQHYPPEHLVPLGQPRQDPMPLLNLAKTCRTLYQHAKRFAYHDLGIRFSEPATILKFLDCISSHPDLAKLVRCLDIGADQYPLGSFWLSIQNQMVRLEMYKDWPLLAYWKVPSGELDFDQDGSIMMWDINNMGDDDLNEVRRLPRKPHDILVDVILSMLPNLEQLILEVTPGAVHGRFMPVSAKLESLRYLCIGRHTDGYSMNVPYRLSGIKCLLEKAVNLESLEINFSPSKSFFSHLPPCLGNLRSLKISGALFPSIELKSLVDQCPRLEVFTYTYHNGLSPDELRKGFKLETLPRALASRTDTLQHVEIHWQLKKGRPHRDYHVGSFKRFTKLKTLTLSGRSILLAEVRDETPLETSLSSLLPASIQTVELKGQHLDLYEPILGLAKEAEKGLFPQLKTFRQTDVDKDRPSYSVELKEAMGKSGISFETYPKLAWWN